MQRKIYLSLVLCTHMQYLALLKSPSHVHVFLYTYIFILDVFQIIQKTDTIFLRLLSETIYI